MNAEKVLVLGASDNPNRISFSLVKLLRNRGYDLYAMGRRKGSIENIIIHGEDDRTHCADIITILLQPKRQKKFYNYIISLRPKKIVLHPGSENPELEFLAQKNHIEVMKGCTFGFVVTNFS